MEKNINKNLFIVLSVFLILTLMGCPNTDSISDETTTDKLLGKILVINVNGDNNGDAESFGQLPNIVRKIRNIKNTRSSSSTKPVIKDRNISNFIANKQNKIASTRSLARAKLTEESNTHTFHIQKEDESFTTLDATLRYGSTDSKCLIYVENGKEAEHDWNSAGEKFDTEIYPKDIEYFGNPTDVDGNGKVVILYYAMDQDYLGYFWAYDLYDEPNSNQMEIFYMNIGWAGPDDPEMIRTLAHEFQHMINYGNRVYLNDKSGMDTWLDEALAESAEHVVFNSPGQSRIDTFVSDPEGLISNGLPLCVWGDGEVENYSLVYLFMQYCRIHATDGVGIYKKLINHQYGDYRGIEDIMKVQNTEFTDFETLSTSYRIANLLQDNTGIYGYGKDSDIFKLEVNSLTNSTTELKPGGCIYIDVTQENIDSFIPENSGTNIRYYKIIDNTVTLISKI